MRRNLLTLAVLFGLVGLSALIWHFTNRPTVYRIAVGPALSEDVRLVASMGRAFARERSAFRLKPVVVEDAAAAARAIDSGQADMAIVRSDIGMPETGSTVAVMRRNAAVLIALPDSGIETPPDLSGRTIGVLRGSRANVSVLRTILRQYEIEPEAVTLKLLTPSELAPALAEKSIQGLLVIGSPAGPTLSDAVTTMARAGLAPVFLPLADAEAIAQRNPAFEAIEVVRGVFGGAPARPAETFQTLGAPTLLMARRDLDEHLVGAFTQILFALRPRIAVEAPLASQIEAPDTEKGSAILVHPGAAAYYDGEQKTFFERYGDWFYLGVMGLSLLGSGAAGLLGVGAARRRRFTTSMLMELAQMQRAARSADLEELAALDVRADDILSATLEGAASGAVAETSLGAFRLAFDEFRHAAAIRREALGAPAIAAPPGLRAIRA